MEKFGFFNAINNDRSYDAEDVAMYLRKYFTTGIFEGDFNVSVSDMNINVEPGDANINGYRYTLTDTLNLTCSIGDTNYSRIDNLIIRLDKENRQINMMIVEGSPSSSPTAPIPQKTNSIYDLVLYQITVPPGTSKLTRDLIKDTRFNDNLCGIVAGAVKQISTEEIFSQYETYFNNWFENIKETLSGDVAGNLQKEIDDINEKIKTGEKLQESGVYLGTCTDEELQNAK